MSSIDQEQLAEYAKKIKEYNRQAEEAFFEWDIEALAIIVSDYISLKKSIHISEIDCHVINIPDEEVKDIYKKVFSKKLKIDQIIQSIDTGEPIEDLNDDEIESLSDLLYAKFSHHEYVRNLFEINSLLLTRRVPRNMEIYISEARYCFAFEQYNAVYSLSRTIVEFTLKYLYCIKNKESLEIIAKQKFKIGNLRDDLCDNDEDLNNEIKRIYDYESDLIHGKKVVSRLEAKKIFHDTLDVIQKLYSKYEPASLAPKPLIFKSS
jgi:hypothetical protein